LQLHAHATVHQYRELGVFVRDCIDRIEHTIGRADRWTVKIVPDRVCFSCEVAVHIGDAVLQVCGNGFDGAVAGWEAFRKLENVVRESDRDRRGAV